MEERNNWTALNSLLRSMESENIQDYNFDGISKLIKYESEKLHGDHSQVIRSISNLSMHLHKLDAMEENCFHPGQKKELKESLNLLLDAFKARDKYLSENKPKINETYSTFREIFLQKFGNLEKYDALIQELRNKGLIDGNHIWLVGNKTQQVRQIKYIVKFYDLGINQNELREISNRTFKTDFSKDLLKKSISDPFNVFLLELE